MKTRETELFLKSLFLNLIILNVSFIVWFSRGIRLADYQIIGNYLLFLNFSWILTQVVFIRKTFYPGSNFIHRIVRISNQMLIFILISSLSLFLIEPGTITISFFAAYWAIFFAVELLVNVFVYHYLKHEYNRSLKFNRVLIIGFDETGQLLQKFITSNPLLGYKFIGYVNNELSTNSSVLGQPDKLPVLIKKHKIQTVFIIQSLFGDDKTQEYMDICDSLGVRLWLISDTFNQRKRTIKRKTIEGLIVYNPREMPLDNFVPRLVKRSFDIVFSLAVIVLIMSWLYPVLAVLIKLTSKGPVFFTQKRTGYNNSTFNCYKFRTMCVNDKSDTLQATDNDTRITPIGNFLRKKNIDEFPQFVNVLLGNMSVVGPRPHMLNHTEQYSVLINGYLTRHFVKPGITGWAQVNGLHGETDKLWKMEKRVEYDLDYMNNWTFWLDIKIVPMTLFNRKKYLRLVNMKTSSRENESLSKEIDDFVDFQKSK
jgi:Undecaprenyl-phosphate glucose phosphotransferase